MLKDLICEILESLYAHKLRTILTSFGVIWGVFILVVMLGISGGVKDGVLSLFSGFTRNAIWFYGGEEESSMNLRDSGKRILFTRTDLENIRRHFHDEIKISSESLLGDFKVIKADGDQDGWFQVKTVDEEYFVVKGLEVSRGRGFNQKDFQEARNVIIIGDRISQSLFGGGNPIGEEVLIKNQFFTIIGTLDEKSFFAINEQNSIFIPYTSSQLTLSKPEGLPGFGVLTNHYNLEVVESKIKTYLANKYHFNSDDQKALYVINYNEQLSVFSTFFNGFDIFLVFLGFCLLLSGIIGISNVMYIIVKERTGEIGIKKAIGASSSQILKEFILEALTITLISGAIGLFIGLGALKIIDLILIENIDNDSFFSHTNLNVKYIFISILALSMAGFMAGIFPASKAAEISPVEAMKEI